MLGVTYKTAWFMAHRIREAMREGTPRPARRRWQDRGSRRNLCRRQGKNKHIGKRNPKNIGGMGKEVAFTLVERNGRARSLHVAEVTGNTLRPIIVASNVNRKSTLMTDERRPVPSGRQGVRRPRDGQPRRSRNTCAATPIPTPPKDIPRSSSAAFRDLPPRLRAALHRYLAEFDFRYNDRTALGVDDTGAHREVLQGIVGKRLTYRRTREAAHA